MNDRLRKELLLSEKLRRIETRDKILAECHEHQRECILNPSKLKAATCGRQAGKTEMDARYIAVALEACGQNEWVIYAAVTRTLAKDLIMGRLEALNDKYKLGWTIRAHEGVIETPRGGHFRCLGFDKFPELQKTRGYKLRLAIFDEPATYAQHLGQLIEECVGPACIVLDGTILINGTPGPTRAGFWFEASTGLRSQYWTTRWTIRENAHFPRDPEEALRKEREKNGWDEDDPVYLREHEARWATDTNQLVYRVALDGENANTRPLPPDYDRAKWTHVLGIDFGYEPDPCAWTVLAAHPYKNEVYAVHAEKHLKLLGDQAAAITHRLVQEYKPTSVVGDSAAKNYIEEFNRRWGHLTKTSIKGAQKLGKREAIELVNTELRTRRYLIGPGAQVLAQEMSQLPWKDQHKEEEHPGYANDLCDSALYAFREIRAYWHKSEPPPSDPLGSIRERWQARKKKEADEWWGL